MGAEINKFLAYEVVCGIIEKNFYGRSQNNLFQLKKKIEF